jgi:hypothetical protein
VPDAFEQSDRLPLLEVHAAAKALHFCVGNGLPLHNLGWTSNAESMPGARLT